jgi:hypothetical protein
MSGDAVHTIRRTARGDEFMRDRGPQLAVKLLRPVLVGQFRGDERVAPVFNSKISEQLDSDKISSPPKHNRCLDALGVADRPSG